MTLAPFLLFLVEAGMVLYLTCNHFFFSLNRQFVSQEINFSSYDNTQYVSEFNVSASYNYLLC
jgi:hypothetical protein